MRLFVLSKGFKAKKSLSSNSCQDNMPVWPPQGSGVVLVSRPLLLVFLGMGAPSTSVISSQESSHFLPPPDSDPSGLPCSTSRCGVVPSPGAVSLHGLPSSPQWYLGGRAPLSHSIQRAAPQGRSAQTRTASTNRDCGMWNKAIL